MGFRQESSAVDKCLAGLFSGLGCASRATRLFFVCFGKGFLVTAIYVCGANRCFLSQFRSQTMKLAEPAATPQLRRRGSVLDVHLP